MPLTRTLCWLWLLVTACSSGGPAGNAGDAGAAADAANAGACVRAVGGPGRASHVLRFERAQPFLRVHLARKFVDAGVGESALYQTLGLWIEQAAAGGAITCQAIVEPSALGYTNSHHNWRDSASASAGGIAYALSLHRDLPALTWNITLVATETGSGRAVIDPAALVTTGGPVGLGEHPSRMPIYVSELVPANTSGWKDQANEHEPWIEIFNPWSEAVDLGGYFLSNDPALPRRWSFPSGTVIGRHQYLIVAADGESSESPLHTSFRLSAAGGSVMLSDPNGVSAGERSYPAVGADRSLRFSSLTDGFEPGPSPTPGGGEI